MAAACGGLEGATWQEAQEWHRDGGTRLLGLWRKHIMPHQPNLRHSRVSSDDQTWKGHERNGKTWGRPGSCRNDLNETGDLTMKFAHHRGRIPGK